MGKEEELLDEEEKLSQEDDNTEIPPDDIVAYNELRSCADIFRMHDKKQLIIQPDFQRDVVWPNPAKTRFIDSLIKQLPIPSMCISLDHKTQERLVIDGLQRISTIIDFLNIDKEFKLSALEDIDPDIAGKTNHQIREKQKELYEKVENWTIPVTVLRCDTSKNNHMNYLFTIFHRLNTGGNKLNNQEIRNCIFHGKFNDLLKGLASSRHFMDLFKLKSGKSYRFKYEELVLRFLSFAENYEKYNGKLAKYLNDHMENYKEVKDDEIVRIEEEFNSIILIIPNKLKLPMKFENMSKAVHEAIYVGIKRNLELIKTQTSTQLETKINKLISDQHFTTDSLKEGLSQKERVLERLKKAIEIFSEQ